MKIDSHMHMNFRGIGVKELISYMDREGLDKCWLLTWEEVQPPTAFYYQHLPIHEVFKAYEAYPSRIIPMYAPDPTSPDALERFLKWREKGIRGFGELKVTIGWDAPQLDGLLSCLNELGVPLVFHMEAGRHLYQPLTSSLLDKFFARLLNTPRLKKLPGKVIDLAAARVRWLKERKEKMRFFFPGYLLDFAALERRLVEFPNIKFIGHGPMFWRGFSPYNEDDERVTCRLMEEYDNLYADLSAYSGYMALSRDPEFTRGFLIKHSRRVLYGTDNFSMGLGRFLDSLNLPGDVRDRIYGENAEKVLEGGSSSLKSRLAS